MGVLEQIVNVFLVLWYTVEALVKTCIPWKWRTRKDVTGDIVLVTGAGSGIGRLLAIQFAKRNAVVVLWDMNKEGNQETLEKIKAEGGSAHAYTVNVTLSDEVYKCADTVNRDVGPVTILVNNAGVVTGKSLMECPDSKIKTTMDVNATSHFWLLKSFLPSMKTNNRGHIVTIASLAGHLPVKNLVDYCASKFAAVGLHSTLRLELMLEGYDGINMTLVCPTFISTGMFEGVKHEFLNPDYAVSKIMDAVLLNEAILCVPGSAFMLLVIKHLIPEKVALLIHRNNGLDNSMDTFIGRDKHK